MDRPILQIKLHLPRPDARQVSRSRRSAPQKEHVIFEMSAHCPCCEEAERFVSLVRGLKERWNLE